MRTLLFIFTVFFCLAANAAVYKSVQADGTVLYSDQPPQPEAEAATMPPLQGMKPVSPASGPSASPQPQSAEDGYSQLEITAPVEGMTIRDNAGNVLVQLTLAPSLRTTLGHTITITIDGQAAATGITSDSVTLENVDRGTHTLGVQVVGRDGSILIAAKPISFHLLRTSVLQRQNRAP